MTPLSLFSGLRQGLFNPAAAIVVLAAVRKGNEKGSLNVRLPFL